MNDKRMLNMMICAQGIANSIAFAKNVHSTDIRRQYYDLLDAEKHAETLIAILRCEAGMLFDKMNYEKEHLTTNDTEEVKKKIEKKFDDTLLSIMDMPLE